MSYTDIEERIKKILAKNRQGMTISAIARELGIHRHTVTKYIYEMKGAGSIIVRDMGTLKLCYLAKKGKSSKRKREFVLILISVIFFVSLFFRPTEITFALTPTPSPPNVIQSPSRVLVGNPITFTCSGCNPSAEGSEIKLYICRDTSCSNCGIVKTTTTNIIFGNSSTASVEVDKQNTTLEDNNFGYIRILDIDSGAHEANWTWDFGSLKTGNFTLKWYAKTEPCTTCGTGYTSSVTVTASISADMTSWTNLDTVTLSTGQWSSVYWSNRTGTYRYLRINISSGTTYKANVSVYVDVAYVAEEGVSNCWTNSSFVASNPSASYTTTAADLGSHDYGARTCEYQPPHNITTCSNITTDTFTVVQAPQWSGNISSTPPQYNPNYYSWFNVTWQDREDSVGFNVSLIEINLTGTLQNYTASREGNTSYYKVVLPAGTFQWRFYANDSDNYWNSTDVWYATVQQNQTNPVNLYLNGTLNSNRTYTYPEVINATGVAVYTNSGTVNLYRGGVLTSNPEIIRLGNGTYVYKVNITGNQNYTSNSTGVTYYAFVNKGDPSGYMGLFIDGSASDKTIAYPTIANVSANETAVGDSDVVYTLWRDNTQLINGSNVWNATKLGNATYTFRYNTTGGANWTSGSATNRILYVLKGSVPLRLAINGTEASQTFIYENVTNTTGWSGVTGEDLTFNLYRGGTPVAIDQPGSISDVLRLGVGGYTYVYNTSGGANYTSNSTSLTLTINAKTINIYLALNGTQGNRTYTYPEAVNATAWKDVTINNEGTVTLLRDGVSKGSGQAVTEEILLGNGTYNYSATFSATNYTATNILANRFALVNKGVLSGSVSAPSVTYPTSLSVSSSESNGGDSDVAYRVYCDNTLVASATGSAPSGSYNFGAGSYTCKLNTTSGPFANWTANSSIASVSTAVQQNTSTINFMNLTIDGTENNKTVAYETYTNATGWYSSSVFGNQQITFTLLRNGQSAGSPTPTSNPVTDYLILGNGSYNYTYYTEGNQNYSSASKTYWVFVNKRTPTINLFLNGTDGDMVYHYGEIVNSTITTDTLYSVNVELWNNLTGIYQQWYSGSSPLQNLTTLVYAPGPYNFTANFTGDNNYTAGYDSHILTLWHWANVTELAISGLYDGNRVNRSSNTVVTCRVLDANTSQAIANYPVNFYKNTTLLGTNYTNSTGYAVWYWNSTPDPVGPYTIKCNITDNSTLYYNDSVSEMALNIELWRRLYLDLTVSPSSIYRNGTAATPGSSTFTSHLYDDNNTNIQSPTDNIYFYVLGLGESFSCASGTAGTCSLSPPYDPSDTINPGNYTIYSNHTTYSYSHPASDTKYLEIRGLLRPRIDTPSNGQIFHKNESISLNSTILDENAQTVPSTTINWTLNGTQISSLEDDSWTIPLTQTSGVYYLNITVNKTYYDTGRSNVTIEIWGYYTTINAPSAYAIWHKTDTVTLNSSVRDERDNALASWSWANWTLNGTQVGSSNVSTWVVPSGHSLGLHQLNITLFTTYAVKNYTWVYVFGWSNLTSITPSSGSFAQGEIVPVACRVLDANTSQAIANYPVNFYKNDTLQATNYTNSTGYAVWYWNTTTEAAGSYTIKCNITDNSTLYYNATAFNQQSATLGISNMLSIDQILRQYDTIYRNDTYASTWGYNYMSNITVHVLEAALGSSENANVTFYNSTDYLGSCLTNSTGHCEFTFNPPDSITPQNYTITLNATKAGFTPSSTNVTWIVVKSALYITNLILPSSPLYKTHAYWLNSTIVSYDNWQPEVEGVSVNWTNSSGGLLATGINTTWTIPADYPVGSITFNATATKDFYDPYSKSGSRTIYGYSNVSLLAPVGGNYDRGSVVNILCRVVDANSSLGIEGYEIRFWNDTTNPYNATSNSTGYGNYSWNTSYLTIGPHNLNCTITNNATLFYDASTSNSYTTVNLIGNLTSQLISISQTTVYRNDTYSPNYSNITVRVLDEYSNSVENSNVSFYQNGSYIGYCLTNSSGYCVFTYNPQDTLTPGNYSIKFNATKQYYHASNTVETYVEVKGLLAVTIESPQAGAFHRGDTLWLNSTVKDENSDSVAGATVSWYNSTGGLLASATSPGNVTWTIPYSYTLGQETLNATATKQYYDSASANRSIEIWRWINVSVTTPANGSIYVIGSIVNITCRVLDTNTSEAIDNYLVRTYIDESLKDSNSTNSTGYTNYTWNTAQEVAGPHNIKCNITDNSTLYYNASIKEHTIIVTLASSLNVDSLVTQYTSIYRNNSFSPSSTNITAHVRDDANNNIEGANVSFYNSTTYLGSCSTNSTGYCYYEYNPPDTLTPQQTTIYVNATKPNYVDSSTASTSINVTGKLYPSIAYPLNGKFYRNETVQLNSTTRDENGNLVTPDAANWTLDGEYLNNTENATWQVPINHATGSFTLNYSVRKDYYDSNFNTTSMQVWSKANVTLYSPLDAVYDRGASITYYANVTDYYNSSAVPGYNCSWWLDGSYAGSSLTNSVGTCNWTWSTGCANSVGSHVINSTIASNASIFYDPKVNNSYTATTLLGSLRIVVDSPVNNSVWHKTDTIWLNSTVRDECSLPVAGPTVNWTLSNTETIGTGVNTSWTVPANYARGQFFVNATTNKTNYHSAFNTSYIEIWGWSNVSWVSPASGTYNHTQVLTLVCKVSDANSSAGIPNYRVNFWKNGQAFGSNSTVSDGTTSLLWGTATESLGSYSWMCNITDNATQFYNVSIRESSATLVLQDVTAPSFVDSYLSPTKLEANYENVTIRINVTDNINVSRVWANFTLPSGGNSIVSMSLIAGNSSNGRWEANYTPTQGGKHNVTVYANDTSGNTNSTFAGSFNVTGTATGYELQDPQSQTAANITLANNYTFDVTVVLKNVGSSSFENNGTMRFVNLSVSLPAGFYSNSTFEQCGNLSVGQNCTRGFRINVTVDATAGLTYDVNVTGRWQNPDYTIGSLLNRTSVYVAYNPVLILDKEEITDSVKHGTWKEVNYTIQSFGNYLLQTISNFNSGGNLSSSWLTFTPASLSFLAKKATQLVKVNVSIPLGQDPGTYLTNVTSNATGSSCNPASNCWDSLLLNITVPWDKSWSISPTLQNLTVPVNTTGNFTITVHNSGNKDVTYSITKSGDDAAMATTTCPSTIFVPKATSVDVVCDYDSSGTPGGNYTLYLTFSNTTYADPSSITATVGMEVKDVPPRIDDPSVTPNKLDQNYEQVTISASVSDNIEIDFVWINITLPNGTNEIISRDLPASTKTYSLSEKYTPTQAGVYYVRIYANDTQTPVGAVNSTQLFNFTSVATTSVSVIPNVTFATINGITLSQGASLPVNVTLNNTGEGGAYWVNLSVGLPSGWPSISPVSYGNITEGSNKSSSIVITIPAGTSPRLYTVTLTASWTNPNNTLGQSWQTININVTSNPVLDIVQTSLSMSMKPEESNSTYFTLNSIGNDAVRNITISCIGVQCTDFNITTTPSSISSLPPNSAQDITVNLSIPAGYTPGSYDVMFNASGNYTWDKVNLTVTIASDWRWNITPESFTRTVGTDSLGLLGNIEISNLGNVPILFNVSKEGNASEYLLLNTTQPTVEKLSKGYVEVKFNTSTAGNFYANISITNSSAVPVQRNVTVSLTVIELRVDLLSPTQASPLMNVRANDTVEIEANATYEGILSENMTWKVYFNSTECPVSSYAFMTDRWKVNCTAPAIADGRNYTLYVYGTYTTYDATAVDHEDNAINYLDVSPPAIANVTANSAKQGQSVTISADVLDNVAVAQAVVEIKYPNATKANFTMSNTTPTHYTYTFTDTSAVGDYDYKVYAWDAENNTNTSESWFEVYTEILFSGYTKDQTGNAVSTHFQFYRNDKPRTSLYLIHNFSSNATTGEFNQTLHKRTYDAAVSFFKDRLDFAGLITNTDIHQDILIGNLSGPAVNIPNAKTKLRGVALNMSFNFTNVTITLDYSDQVSSVGVEDNVRIFKCAGWDFTSWNCTSGWVVLPTVLDKINHRASTTATSLSAYFVGEYQEVVTTTTLPPGYPGYPGGGGPIPNVTTTTTTVPPIKPIQFSTETIEVTVAPGEYQIISLGVVNNLDEKINATLSAEGRVWEFVQFEKTSLEIEGKSTEYVNVKFFATSTTPEGTYMGNLVVTSDNITGKVPVRLIVQLKPRPLLDITLDVLTPKLLAGETLRLRTTLYTFGEVAKVDVTVNYTVEKAEVKEVVLKTADTVAVERRLEYTKSILLPKDIEEGRYLVEAFASYDNRTASAIVSFEVVKEAPIITILRMLLTDWRTYAVIAGLIVGYLALRRYVAWRIKKAAAKKYIFPLDFKKLPRGVKVGKVAETNIDAYWDLDKLTQHMIIAGGTGSGKTVAAMVMAEEALKKGIPVIVFDPTAQWTGFVRACRDEHMLRLYGRFGLRPEDATAFKGNIVDVVDPGMKIEIEKYTNKGEITVFCLTKLTPSQLDAFVTKTIDAIFNVPWEESRKLRLLIVYDEVHRLLPKYGGRKGYLALERGVREFRKWGIGLVMISQVLSDFKGAIRAVIASEGQMRTKYSGDIDRVKKAYGAEYAATLPKLKVGTGMVQNPEFNEGRPWFIEFRPLLHDTSRIPERELSLYRKYQEELDKIEEAVEAMKKAGMDTYDIELELRLAREKVKQAQFRMAETYIESLKARIKR